MWVCWGGLQWDSGLVSSRERAPLWDGAGGTGALGASGACVDSVAISTEPYRWQTRQRPHLSHLFHRGRVAGSSVSGGGPGAKTSAERRCHDIRVCAGTGPKFLQIPPAREAGKGPPNCASRRVSDENAWSVCWAGLRRCSPVRVVCCCAWQSPAGPVRLSGPVSGRAWQLGNRRAAGSPLWSREVAVSPTTAVALVLRLVLFWPGFTARIQKKTQICEARSIFIFFVFLFSRWSLVQVQNVGPAQLAVPRTSAPASKPTARWIGCPQGRWHPAKPHAFRLGCPPPLWSETARHGAFRPSQHSQHSVGETMACRMLTAAVLFFGRDTTAAHSGLLLVLEGPLPCLAAVR